MTLDRFQMEWLDSRIESHPNGGCAMGVRSGKIIFVDLNSGRIEEESLPEAFSRRFLGGAGLGARVIYERTKPGAAPLGPGNVLGFVPGLLTGTATPMASKFSVVAKSPLTGSWGDANSGGLFGADLKTAGLDGVFFTGVSPKPVYLLIRDGKVELRDAAHLWGEETGETERVLRREVGEKKLRIASIGPSGELCSLISSVIVDGGRAAGRSGVGAVMGSKNLKAIAVKGSGRVEIADGERFNRLKRVATEHLRDFNSLPFIKMLSALGTCNGPVSLVPTGAAPIRNWSLNGKEAFPDYVRIAGESITKYQLRRSGCGNCPISCGGVVRVKDGPYATEGRKPEYETIGAFGLMCLNSDAESIIKANEICDRYGIDTISAGSTIAFAMECYENGLIGKEDTGGIELTWGNAKAIIAMLDRMVRREGFGDVLADGVQKAAERIGKGVEKYAVHIHGQEPGLHDPKFSPYRGLTYIANPTPGRHMTAAASMRLEGERKLASSPELRAPEGGSEYERMGRTHALGVSYSEAFSNAGMCLHALSSGTDYPLAELIAAVTGWDFTVAEAIEAGRRALTLRQAFNVREGLTARDFSLPDRIGRPPHDGPLAGRNIDFEELRANYHLAMGWDASTGIPLPETITELGLEEVVGTAL